MNELFDLMKTNQIVCFFIIFGSAMLLNSILKIVLHIYFDDKRRNSK